MEKVKYPTISIAKAPVAKAIHTKNILNYSIALFKRSLLSALNANSTVSGFINSFRLNSTRLLQYSSLARVDTGVEQ